MTSHSEKVQSICASIRAHEGGDPLSIRKKAVSHEVPKRFDRRAKDRKIDISDLDSILSIDTEYNTCVAEPGITFGRLVGETLKVGLVPIIVPELKTITIGGAVAGGSLESMSFKYGGFHDTCLEYEVVTGKGEVLECTPENENKLVFQMVHGTFGTLGIITKLKFRLIPAKPFVKVSFERYGSIREYKEAIMLHKRKEDIQYMDGMVHSPSMYVLHTADQVDEAPYVSRYDWTKAFHESSRNLKEDYLRIEDYLFRYDKGVTHTWPESFLGRLALRRIVGSNTALRLAQDHRWLMSIRKVPITVDVFIPFSKADEFLEWYRNEISHYPLWCVPYTRVRDYEWISREFIDNHPSEGLFLDFALYGMKDDGRKDYYRLIEEELLRIGGLKTLISGNSFTEEEFWSVWNRENYFKVKERTDPANKFRDLYEKTCLTTRGLSR